MSGIVVDKANLLRARLHDDLSSRWEGHPDAPYQLRNIQQKTFTGITVTGHAQSIHCKFCGRQIGVLPARPKNKRGHNKSVFAPQALYDITNAHLEPCALVWLRATLCRWSTGLLSIDEHDHVVAWQKKHMSPVRETDGPYERRDRIPHELDGIFDNLPEPPGHPMAQALEVALVAISRLWVPESRP